MTEVMVVLVVSLWILTLYILITVEQIRDRIGEIHGQVGKLSNERKARAKQIERVGDDAINQTMRGTSQDSWAEDSAT